MITVAGAVDQDKIANDAVDPEKMTFPVFYAASPSGGSVSVPAGGLEPYPVTDNKWTQEPGSLNVVFGGAVGTLAYDGSGSGSCQAFVEISVDGTPVGGGNMTTTSTTPVEVSPVLGAQPEIDPVTPTDRELTVKIGSNGDCTPASTIDSVRFRVLDFG